MKAVYFHTIGAIALTFTLAACVPSAQAPAPTPPPVQRPAPTPAPPPVVQEPRYDNYLDAPQTPGGWQYGAETQETFAIFADGNRPPEAIIRCDLRTRQIGIGRFVPNDPRTLRPKAAMNVQAETTSRRLEATIRESMFPLLVSDLDARDPLLDAIAITKGRFAVRVEGVRTLYLPAWVEVSRVIEDCR